jgi:hypothetical protein
MPECLYVRPLRKIAMLVPDFIPQGIAAPRLRGISVAVGISFRTSYFFQIFETLI